MYLTREEKDMLDGKHGEGVQKAMRILTALGEIYDADRFIEVRSVQISGISYKNIGDAGLDFLNEWADKGAKVRVPLVTLNPSGMDLIGWKRFGIPKKFAKKQLQVIEAFRKMNIKPECTCTPYLTGNLPGLGEHISWSESSAVSYANSVLGSRTNRESGISALASAITGRTPNYGYHLYENRKADFVVEINCRVEGISDFGALGYLLGKMVNAGVPYLRGIKRADRDELKTLGASMAASGAVALYHIEGITPESMERNIIKENAKNIVIESLDKAYNELNSGTKTIDLVAIGCPHASIDEISKIATLLKGEKIKSELWITTSRKIKKLAENKGFVRVIESAGGKVVVDTCMVVAPIEELGFRTMATNAGKAAFYCPSHCGLEIRFGSTERCINAAINGTWK